MDPSNSLVPVHVVGGGLAGSEAAWQLAQRGVPVCLHEMRPQTATPVHKTGDFAELVCSNSFRSDDAQNNAVGVLHAEMRQAGSLIMAMADAHQVPAGGALAVDRLGFAAAVTEKLNTHPNVTIEIGEVDALPPAEWGLSIIATGPLTGAALADSIAQTTGEGELAFFDAIAPIVYRDSVDMNIAWYQSRYDKVGPGGTGADYINCPMDRDCYNAFIDALLGAQTMDFHDWEKDTPYFEGCLPIEIMAARGRETLRYGPMKPVGLTNPRDRETKSHAIVQLRQDNALGTLYNLVGFQTKMKYGEQVRVLRMIPGLQDAEFARLGGIHRNTFINSPKLLDATLRLKAAPHLRFAGQMTGCEGYVESAAIGLLTACFTAADIAGAELAPPPPTTAHGAILAHITGGHLGEDGVRRGTFQPMNVNFGLFPPVESVPTHIDGKRLKGKEKTWARKRQMADRALRDFAGWISATGARAAA